MFNLVSFLCKLVHQLRRKYTVSCGGPDIGDFSGLTPKQQQDLEEYVTHILTDPEAPLEEVVPKYGELPLLKRAEHQMVHALVVALKDYQGGGLEEEEDTSPPLEAPEPVAAETAEAPEKPEPEAEEYDSPEPVGEGQAEEAEEEKPE